MIESNQSGSEGNLAGELVVRYIEEPETSLVERRDFSGKAVVLQVQNVQPLELEEARWNLTGYLVSGEDDHFEAVQAGEGAREVAGEFVVAEKEGF